MVSPDRRTASALLTILLFAIVLAVVYIARTVIVIFAFSILFAYLISLIVRFLQRHSFFFKNLRGPHVVEAYLALIALTVLLSHGLFPEFRKSRARLLIEQSHSAALEGPPPYRRSDRFHLCFVAAPDVLAKARALAMDARRTDRSDCARHNERDPVDPCLAADGASARCRNFLDLARTCVRRSVVCHPPFGRYGFPKEEHRR